MTRTHIPGNARTIPSFGTCPSSLKLSAIEASAQFASGGYAVPGWPLPVTPVTPPAVVSGAASSTIRFTITLP